MLLESRAGRHDPPAAISGDEGLCEKKRSWYIDNQR